MDRSRLPPYLAELVADLELLERGERIEYLISLADQFESVPARIAVPPWPEAAKVRGCESEVFAFAEARPDATLDFYFAVDNPQGITAKAWAHVLQTGLSGAPAEVVAAVSSDLVYEVFGRELSMGKNLGLTGMLGSVQQLARLADQLATNGAS